MIKVMQSKCTKGTDQGLERLENELQNLRTVKRAEIAQNLHDTMGDEEDNEHFLALDEKYFVEGRSQEIEALLGNAKLIALGNLNGCVQLGSTIVIRENFMPMETYTIVGSAETNPQAGLISYESPLGRAHIGRRAGESIDVQVPEGKMKFHLVAVG